MKILFVDDEPEFAEMFKAAGKMTGVEVYVLEKATLAIDFLAEQKYDIDVAVLDLSIPEFDGLSLCKRIRLNEKNYRETQMDIVFYTGIGENETVLKIAKENGVRKIFSKPYPVSDLLMELKSWENKNELRKSNA